MSHHGGVSTSLQPEGPMANLGSALGSVHTTWVQKRKSPRAGEKLVYSYVHMTSLWRTRVNMKHFSHAVFELWYICIVLALYQRCFPSSLVQFDAISLQLISNNYPGSSSNENMMDCLMLWLCRAAQTLLVVIVVACFSLHYNWWSESNRKLIKSILYPRPCVHRFSTLLRRY